MTWHEVAVFGLWGALGGAVRVLVVSQGRIIFPRRVQLPDGRMALDLGFVLTIVLGIGTALLVDGVPATAFWAAMGAPHLLEEAVKRVPPKNGGS